MNIDQLKDEIRNTPLSDIVGKFISLQKKGQNYEGICPFHTDSHPSLKVSNQKGLFKCFACDAGGDAIGFVSKFKKIGFRETMTELANLLNVPLDNLSKAPSLQDVKFDQAKELLTILNKIFVDFRDRDGKDLFNEFTKMRGLHPQIIEQFQIGFAPKNNVLYQTILKLENSGKKGLLNLAINLGLIKKSHLQQNNPNYQNSEYYDFFRFRITFPIWDERGTIRGFSTRSINTDQIPKYLNSSESFYFHKEKILFGLNFAKINIQENNKVILVEGHMDAIAMFQVGFNYTLASMGTSFNVNHIKNLKHLTKNFILGFDSDNAGLNFAKKLMISLLQADLNPKFLHFSPAKDADEYIKKFGSVKMQELIDQAPYALNFFLEQLVNPNTEKNVDLKIQTFHEGIKLINHLNDKLLRNEYVILWGKKLNVKSKDNELIELANTQYVVQETQTAGQQRNFSMQHEVMNSQNHSESLGPSDLPSQENYPEDEDLNLPEAEPTRSLTPKELKIFKTLILHPQIMTHELAHSLILELNHPEITPIAKKINEIFENNLQKEYISQMKNHLEENNYSPIIHETIQSSLFLYLEVTLDSQQLNKLVWDLRKRLIEEKLQEKRNQIIKKHKECESDETALELLSHIQKLNDDLKNINEFVKKPLN